MIRTVRIGLGVMLGGVAALSAGCRQDVRLAGRKIRSVTVAAVTHYGVTLDEQASPEQVAYVLLRAIREDFEATTDAQREAALDKQFDICAANVIEEKNRTGMKREEFIYNVVYRWTPTVSHYVQDFETDWEAAQKRFVRFGPSPAGGDNSDPTECTVAMEVDDPRGDPNARVVLLVWLARDSGFWRVVHLGFDPTRRSLGK